MRRSVALLFVLAACGRHEPAPSAPASSAAIDGASDAIALAPPDAGAPSPLVELAAQARWQDVIATIDALSEKERAEPGTRFLRARAALWVGDAKKALELTEGLSIPAIATFVERVRALAQLEVGPYADAGRWFAAQSDTESQLLAGLAFEKAGEKASARAIAGRIVKGKHGRRTEARARALRLRLGEDPEEVDDALWLETKAAELPEAKDAERSKKKRPLGPAEIAERARTLADAGKVDDALASVAKLAAGSERDRLRADVLYRGKRYAEAAKAWDECAKKGGPHAVEDAFTAARALSRADRDDDAAKAWQEIAKKHPRSSFADESTYMVARLHFLHARWASAAAGFDDYLKTFPAGVDRKDALRNRAIARLLDGELDAAKKELAALAKSEPDELQRARLANLEALAEQRAGNAKAANDAWTDVAKRAPLSWPALVARARLAAAKESVPAAIDPPKSGPTPPALGVALPNGARMLHGLGLDSEAERDLLAHEAEVRSGSGDRGVQALCDAYGAIDRGKRRLSLSGAIAPATFDTAPSPASRWAWECAFPRPFARVVGEIEEREKLPAGLVHAVMRQESGFDPEVVSPARAVGLMQLLPETAEAVAKETGVEHQEDWLVRPPHNIALGAHYLAVLLARFKGQIPLAVAAYNAGPEAVEKWSARAKGLDVDMFVETIPYLETRGYVVRVMGNLARYAYLAKGDAPSVPLAIER